MDERITQDRLIDVFERFRFINLGTVDVDGFPWVSTVFFHFDYEFKVYFYSLPTTQHSVNIQSNPEVAFTISSQSAENGHVEGVVYVGKALLLQGADEESAFDFYRQRFNWIEEFPREHLMYVIIPREIWMINSELLGHSRRVKVF